FDTFNLDNIIILPSAVTSIGESAFRNCYSIKAVVWDDVTAVNLSTIKEETFRNCIGLKYFVLPSSVKEIKGRSVVNGTEKAGAFQISNATPSGSYAVADNLYLAIASNSQLETIGDQAFIVINKPDSLNNKLGLKLFFTSYTRPASSREVTSDYKFTFGNLTYIGTAAFNNRVNLTGIWAFSKYITVGARSFVGTDLTDLHFKWDSEQVDYIENSDSSIIGSSSQFINKGYVSNATPSAGYYSLRTIFEKEKTGLFDIWMEQFSNINSLNTDFSEYDDFFNQSLNLGTSDPLGYIKDYVPNSSKGLENDELKQDVNSSSNTKNYLRADVEWVSGKQGVAKETVNFEYKNSQPVDYIFIVDYSSSMDEATQITNKDSGTAEKNAALSFTNNASKLMNSFAILYDISQRILDGNTSNVTTSNTVSIISFSNNSNNEMKNSSTLVGEKAMISASQIKKALFEDYQYPPGATNYSSGLARAYNLIVDLKQNASTRTHKKVVVMLTDGQPELYGQDEPAHNSNLWGII
ncbi:MAG: leucine-rich repeat protein, partial [Ruminococcus sp.]|nr:leucine-rich repeat protein [Ruminococcus sp.]